MRIVTLSFDDGYEASSLKTAEIYESFGVCACFNIIAIGRVPRTYANHKVGDFVLWNELQDRGHEIMPHGFDHEKLNKMPILAAHESIQKCLDMFKAELNGFVPEASIFNFPHHKSTDELNDWLRSQVRAIRIKGEGINHLPGPDTFQFTCRAYNEGVNLEELLDKEVELLHSQPSGWLVFNLHGIDDEGWMPIASDFLRRSISKVLDLGMSLLPAGQVLDLGLPDLAAKNDH